MSKFFQIALSLVFIFGCSCSEELVYSEQEILRMAQKIAPEVKIILPKSLNDGVQCFDYTQGCLGGKRAKLRKVIITVVHFDSEEHARQAAFAIDQFYIRNWVFDDVAGEPVLEDFVKKAFNAKRPAKEIKDKT